MLFPYKDIYNNKFEIIDKIHDKYINNYISDD